MRVLQYLVLLERYGLVAMNLETNTMGDTDLLPHTESEVVRIERPTLHNVVVSRIRDMIIEGQLPTGVRIHEGRVGQQLGVSRTPLREALKVLANEGLVELIPNRGATVRKLTAKEVRDMLAVLTTLEELAGSLTCQNASDADIQEVRRQHDEMLKFYSARDRLPYFKLNQQIHSALISLSGNESLAMVHDILQSRMKQIRYLGHRTEDQWAAAVADHEDMIGALEARDGQRLSAAMANHLARTWERIKNAI
ncbi:GntR family transcriptional regulator [Rhodoferax sp.]|uniref:GntR family transcriptional regulator n=2 Tax=Rhodoferax sp. TaxID=50421 RepID=UPI0027372D8D|nr:GntR family transcriptional regulator [Rhodoferax sp.]MDP3190681.1 GntR family transcriptional regulator [Rhodoferax sp.]